MIYTYQSLPANDNLNRFSYSIEVHKEMFIQKGKMIAYYDSLRFEALGSSMFDIMVKEAFNAPLFVNDFVIVTGQGKLILGDNGNDIASYDLDDANLTIKSGHLLAFESTLLCQESAMPGYLTLLGTGKFLASSNGPVHFMEPPVRVDEDALLGWADSPTPSYNYDYEYIRNVFAAISSLVGSHTSGEEKQINFTGQGTILIQSSEGELMGRSKLTSILAQISGLHQNELQELGGTIKSRLQSS